MAHHGVCANWASYSAEASGPKQQARFCSLYQRQAPFQVRIGSMRKEFKTMARVVNPPGRTA